jgi:Reverse transcriptase (RNA-dependent DNA polymerase).
LEEKGISQYLIRMMEAYLCDRIIVGESFEKNMTGGVPQRSILGPTLWSIFYDGVLRLVTPEGVTLIAYPDNLVVVVLARDEEEMEFKLNFTLQEINNWMEDNKLQVAPEKSEAVVIAGKKKNRTINIKLGGGGRG